MLTTYTNFRIVAADLGKSLDRVAKEPQTSREVDYWNAHIGEVKDIESFLSDTRLFRFAMKAYGLGDLGYAKGFMRKVLQGGVDDPASMANRLSDARYKQFAQAFNFARYGQFATGMPAARTETVDRFLRLTLEEKAGATNEGVRLALYFQRKAADLTSPMQILADPALLKVVQVAFSLPTEMSTSPIDNQAAMIAKKLDVASLKDGKALDVFLKRFSAMYDAKTSSAQAATPNLLLSATVAAGVSADTLMSIARLRTGG